MKNELDNSHTPTVGIRRLVLAVMCVPLLSPLFAQAETFNIEIDYMVQGSHSHMPQPEEIAAVVKMFACQGHTLNIEVDTELTHYAVLKRDPDDCSAPGSFIEYDGEAASFGKIKKDNFDHTEGGWHYCIFAHQFEDETCSSAKNSGIAEWWGDDFVVSLGHDRFEDNIGTPFDRAATLVHEFGHNLGLTHCGSEVDPLSGICDIGNAIPNIPSIMSYTYQRRGVRTNLLDMELIPEEAASLFKELDYSHGRMCTLDENSLSESFGTGMISVDWDCDKVISGTVAKNITGFSCGGWCDKDGALDLLVDYDEWGHIKFFAESRSTEPLVNMPVISCIMAEDERAPGGGRGSCPDKPDVIEESCISAKMIYVSTDGLLDFPDYLQAAAGMCFLPFASVQDAHDDATSGSMLFLAPGTYDESGPVDLTTKMTILSVGAADIQ